MELNDLPFDCLSCIFDYFPDLKQLLKLATVCKQWKDLVRNRLNKIRHFHVISKIQDRQEPYEGHLHFEYCSHVKSIHIHTDDIELAEKINVAQLFPNLKYFTKELNLYTQCTCKALANVLATAKPLIGLSSMIICDKDIGAEDFKATSFQCHVDINDIVKHCGSLEYLVTSHQPLLTNFSSKFKFGHKLKHFETVVYPWSHTRVYRKFFRRTPNLETLTLFYQQYAGDVMKWSTMMSPMIKLKRLHLFIKSESQSIFPLLSFCPNLQSLALGIGFSPDEPSKETSVHHNLQDLYIYRPHNDEDCPTVKPMELIDGVLVKFPFCKHLMLSIDNFIMTQEEMIKMISVLPNLILLVLDIPDFRETNIIDNLNSYCRSIDRRIALNLSYKENGSVVQYSLNEDVCKLKDIDNKFVRTYFKSSETVWFV